MHEGAGCVCVRVHVCIEPCMHAMAALVGCIFWHVNTVVTHTGLQGLSGRSGLVLHTVQVEPRLCIQAHTHHRTQLLQA